ncbi:MAG: tRNA glutamyl-Q(34) synthetase GluQRS [Odoribacter sp.]|nr:tRNA glutamyl-Q(34) synthetase GluQRS [Odoribacter sp.]
MTKTDHTTSPVGRFAPSPSGRMHLGNMFTALLSWLSVKSHGGKWILRIEDLDPQRSRMSHAHMIEEDLAWLGLTWDEGGTEDKGPHRPYCQSERHHLYSEALAKLHHTGYTYPCTCTRADILATQAPHQSDGRIIYSGRCRPTSLPHPLPTTRFNNTAVRLAVPDSDIVINDMIHGPQRINLARQCGDFILRRADGAWAYQLAVTVDDDAMEVTEIMRGNDLLLSAAQQDYIRRLLGLRTATYAHLPLICNKQGIRLSKRDHSLNMETLRSRYTPRELTGILAQMAGISADPNPCTPESLISVFSTKNLRALSTKKKIITLLP